MRIMDLHCDTIYYLTENDACLLETDGQYDLKRANEAGIGVQFFALFTMPLDQISTLRKIMKQMDVYFCEVGKNQEYIVPIFCKEDLSKAESEGKLGGVLHLEGAECIGKDIEILRLFYRLGLRSMGLTWNHRNLLADGVGEGPLAGGLSQKGYEVVKEMERLGMILDLAHIAPKGFYNALDAYSLPVMVTHANIKALCNHRRNLDDHQLKTLADHGGVVGISQVSDFVSNTSADIDAFMDHIVYACDLIGVKHVALGSDFDGTDHVVLPHIGAYKKLPDYLKDRGFTSDEINMILYKNGLEVIKAVL
ncbi:MAG: dipeptidase [Bacillota bacterium]|nr:dipeptidase [Bacillota bacterium]